MLLAGWAAGDCSGECSTRFASFLTFSLSFLTDLLRRMLEEDRLEESSLEDDLRTVHSGLSAAAT